MKTLLCGTALLAVIVVPAAAETPYDRNLEKAATGIVAGKMGGIRGGDAAACGRAQRRTSARCYDRAST
ncbi:hypothetical protein [Mesorhizobium sp. M8A.F.Ca.ET.207.01.1.1]|uniref:hypothetical protein n=1 Tax=Mesorhizobium sp. M8A.F.Ca.ET.207.01.1.1 TaxID=2563968 RepID=UPI001FEED12D|nr:hypothetical protein [Mesorhizobium sp. M8A.F.Ca.ET.207.01.1.1]